LNGSSGYTAPQPRVITVSPENGQTGVALNAVVVAEFSQSLDPSTVTSTNFSIASFSGTLSLSDGVHGPRSIVTFTPNNPWSPNTSYGIYIGTGIKSASGNPLLNYVTSSFSTGVVLTDNVAPYAVKVNPPDGVTSVAVNAVVSVEFSEAMNASTVSTSSLRLLTSGTPVSGRVAKVSSRIFEFVPDALLAPNTSYQVSVASSVKDIAGNPMASAFTSTFTTQTGMDNYQPSVTDVNPVNGASGVPVTATAIITFSEPMDPLTINDDTCYISGPDNWSAKLPGTITLSGGNNVVTITPTQPLFAGRNYYVHATTRTMDIAGNTLASEFSSWFTTAIAPGTTDLPTGATVTINPKSIFANGEISTTVTITNINRNAIPVPNGTIVAITAGPAFNQSSAGGVISGPSSGTSVDNRFLLFTTEGASVTVFYTPPDLDWLMPGATTSGVIQVAAVDLDTRPTTLIAQGTATLFRIKTASLTATPSTLPADGTSQSTVVVTVRDCQDNPVPDGTEVGITASPVFAPDSAGGTIIGGTLSPSDNRIRIFTTSGGQFSFKYQAPSSQGPGYAAIQAVTVNNEGAPTGLIKSININLISP